MSVHVLAATGTGGLDDAVSPVFGRAPTFTLVELEGTEVRGSQVIPNPFQDAGSGAGIQAAQLVAKHNPRAVLAGNFGPNVSGVFAAAGIGMVPVSGMTVQEAVLAYIAGRLAPSSAPAAPRPGIGGGPGRRMGRGAGMGQGMGRGMGRGLGDGMYPSGQGALPGQVRWGASVDPQALKERIADLETQLAEVRRKLREMEGGDRDA
ncbi:MAG TPA: dinitrogenase iron-molybdenum cofactor [Candidatus Acetothermia bacterium]|nr:dinitrogenase iron-molybdenum cofactor [Candidatus Acetothermia bacterium]